MNNDQKVYTGFMVMVECYRRIKFKAGGEEEKRGMWMEKGVIGEGQ